MMLDSEVNDESERVRPGFVLLHGDVTFLAK